VLRTKKQDKETVLSLARKFVPMFAKEKAVGKPWIVEEDHIRIRGEE
jgi:hypothetical protein